MRKLDSIECRDALIAKSAAGMLTEASWPDAEFIVGNPPFLGIRLMRAGLGDETVETLFEVYEGRVSHEADLVVYWFERARSQIKAAKASRAGLVATNSIRGGANREVVDRIETDTRLFEAWSDEPWVVDGAAVRVSILCFGKDDGPLRLDGKIVSVINSDLSGSTVNLTKSRRLQANGDLSFQGVKFGGPFLINSQLARSFLVMPRNPNGHPNSAVIRRWCNGIDITRRREDRWCIDFEPLTSEREAALFEAPYRFIKDAFTAENDRRKSCGEPPLRYRESRTATEWWVHQRPRTEMRERLRGLSRFIVTPEVAKHRLFVFFEPIYLTSGSVYAIARDDDTTFGILHSRFHEAWSLSLGTWLGVGNDPRYTSTTTFETFPFPEGLTPNISAKDYAADPRAKRIAKAAKRLDELAKPGSTHPTSSASSRRLFRGTRTASYPRTQWPPPFCANAR